MNLDDRDEILRELAYGPESSPLGNALMASGVTSAGYVLPHLAYHGAKDIDDFSRVKATRDLEKFMARIQPGDILFHRHSSKDSPLASMAGTKRDLPLTESQIMTLFKGDPYYHTSVYTGGGKTTEAASIAEGIKRTRLAADAAKSPVDYLAYRPKDPKQVAKALEYLERQVGGYYPETESLMRHGATHLFDYTGGPKAKACDVTSRGLVCTELTAQAYPKIAKQRYASPIDIRHSPDVDLVARYARAPKMSAVEQFLAKVGYPLLKSLKYAAPVGALAYLAS